MSIRRPVAGALLALAACLAVVGCGGGGGPQPEQGLRLDPDNARYLEFRGKPTVFVTSTETYGAVMNADFDYVRYLDTLANNGFNLTRVFSSSYVERAPERETTYAYSLTPRPGRFLAPWADSTQRSPYGYPKFDLSKWNPAYFDRLKSFVSEAGKRSIVVEFTLFSALYNYSRWKANPFYSTNNVNRVGTSQPQPLYTLHNGRTLQFQDALVRKTVEELRSFDNVYFEVINEGTSEPAPASAAWQDHIIQTIQKADADSPQKHLIARWYPNEPRRVANPNPAVSISNFHYVQPDNDLGDYDNLEGVLSFDETGTQGTADWPYVRDAWLFLLAGGGIYDNLDWSFTVGREDGTHRLDPRTPGGGGPRLRRSLTAVKRFLERFDLPAMHPAPEIVQDSPAGSTTRVLEQVGRAYAVFIAGGRGGRLALNLPAGRYRAQWVDARTGAVVRTDNVDHPGGDAALKPPRYRDGIALAIDAQ